MNVKNRVTFWSSYCAENITDYVALKEHEKKIGCSSSTTITICIDDIDTIINVFEQESYGGLFFHIH